MRSLTIYIERLQRKGLGKCFCNLATYLCDPSQRNSRKLYYKYRDQILAPLPDIPVKDDCKEKLPVWVCWMPHFCNSNPLYTQLGKPYSEKLWNNILWSSPVHKLTYKFKPATGSQNTIYDHILNLKIEEL